MTMLNPEAIPPQSAIQASDVAASQQNIDPNLPQQNQENLDQKKETKENEESNDPNWKAFREARKKDRAEREAAERRAAEKEQEIAALKAAMEAAFAKGNSPSPQAYQQYYGINEPEETEEQKIERKISELLNKKEQEYKRQREEEELRTFQSRLNKDYPDIPHVCSQENLDYLDYHYPEISRPLQRLPEGYDKWHDIYHAIKKLIPNHSTFKKEAARADINSNKPRSISSTGPSPTGDRPKESWQESQARRAENWARMQRTMRGV